MHNIVTNCLSLKNKLAGRYDNPMLELTIYPSQGL